MDHHAAKQDYQQLTGKGWVLRDTDDTDGWRKAIRARARNDRLRVRTGVSRQMPSRAWAALVDRPPPTHEEMREAAGKLDAYLESFGEASPPRVASSPGRGRRELIRAPRKRPARGVRSAMAAARR